MSYTYAYFTGCLFLFVFWLYIFLKRKDLRKEMLWASLWGMPFGIIDFFLIPAYWNPDTIFGLAKKYGVGIESFLFLFLMSGIVSVVYEFFWSRKLVKLTHTGRGHHWLIFCIPLAYAITLFLFPTKAIYSLIIVGGIGAAITAYLRRDLRRQILFSAIIFSLLYFGVFLLVNLTFPNFVENFYNMRNLCGIMIFGVPLEEILVAFFTGAFWSTIYEYTKSYREKNIG